MAASAETEQSRYVTRDGISDALGDRSKSRLLRPCKLKIRLSVPSYFSTGIVRLAGVGDARRCCAGDRKLVIYQQF